MNVRHHPSTARRFRRLGAAVALGALALSASLTGGPATAATTTSGPEAAPTTTTTTTPTGAPTAPRPAGVTLVSQPSYVNTGGVEVLQLRLDERKLISDPSAEVRITVHESVSTRSEFDRAISGESLGNTVERLAFPVSSLRINRRHNFLVGFGLEGSGVEPAIGVDRAGVYPVEVGVIDDSATIHGTFTTWMVVVDPTDTSAEPLRVSWIWQVETGPLVQPDGTVDPDGIAEMRPGGRLDQIATLLARADAFPLTLAVGPETLETWEAAAGTEPTLAPGFERVRAAVARAATQVLPEPYVPIDGPTIEAEDLGSHLPDEYVAGSNAIDETTGEIPDPRTAFVDPIDDATVDRLTQMLVGRFVVRDTALVPVAEPLTPAQPFVLAAGSDVAAPAAATDTGIEHLIESEGSPALRAQRVVAALAEIAYEAPSLPRGVVLGTPSNWSPAVATTTLLLKDFVKIPLLKPATLDTMFAEVPRSETDAGPLQRELAPTSIPGRLPLQASEYNAAVRELFAFAAMVGTRDPAVRAGQQALLLSLSTANTRSEALAYLDTISTKLDTLTSGITTTAKALTLTARRASVPLSFDNNSGRDNVRVRVHLDSPKLVFPEGSDFVVTLPRGHYTKEFPVEARASGTFAMTITLESPGGGLQLGAPTRVTIRSAVFSGIGIALTLGALLFLAFWWGNHFFRTRRARRRALAQ